MTRRAAVIRDLRRNEAIPVLYIVGADEFGADAVIPDPVETGNASPELVRRIYAGLRPDAGYLSDAAARWFGDFVPDRFVRIEGSPVTRRLMVGGLSVALVFFPPLPAKVREADSSLLNAVLVAANEASDVDLRIGVSPWGFQGEYAAGQGLAQAFHIVLGAGEGAPFALDASAMEPALWVRAAENGRSVMTLELEGCPPRGASPVWIPGVNVRAREIRLEDDIPDDAAMRQLLLELER